MLQRELSAPARPIEFNVASSLGRPDSSVEGWKPSKACRRLGKTGGIVLLCLLGFSVSPCHGGGIEAITRPSEDKTLSFVRPGRLMKVLVKKGEKVRAGQVLAVQDDKVQRAELEALKAEAEDATKIRAAEAQLAQKQVDMKKTQEAAEKNAATEMELEHAALDVTIAKLSLELAKFQSSQARRTYEKACLALEQMRIVSPMDGQVEDIYVTEGESADALAKVLRIVKLDPLWIEVPVPRKLVDQGTLNKVGGSAGVEFEGERTVMGKINHIAGVGDSASETLTVRVEVANEMSRAAGERVKVTLGVNTGKE